MEQILSGDFYGFISFFLQMKEYCEISKIDNIFGFFYPNFKTFYKEEGVVVRGGH